MKNRVINTKQNKWLRKSFYYSKEIEKIDCMVSRYGYENVKTSPFYGHFCDCYPLIMFYYKISLIDENT